MSCQWRCRRRAVFNPDACSAAALAARAAVPVPVATGRLRIRQQQRTPKRAEEVAVHGSLPPAGAYLLQASGCNWAWASTLSCSLETGVNACVHLQKTNGRVALRHAGHGCCTGRAVFSATRAFRPVGIPTGAKRGNVQAALEVMRKELLDYIYSITFRMRLHAALSPSSTGEFRQRALATLPVRDTAC